MDFQGFVDQIAAPCAVLSVERRADGSCGEIRIAAANRRYGEIMGAEVRSGMRYHELVPRDPKFEDFCFRAAFLGRRMHAYVETRGLGCWTDLLLLPMTREREDLGYCQFLFEFTRSAEAGRMASVSVGTSEAVIKACITLMGARDLRESVGAVLQDMLDISGACDCRILLLDHREKRTVNFCRKRRIPDPEDSAAEIPYSLACTWEESLGESNLILVQNARDMAELERENPAWAASMRERGVSSLILSPLRQNEEIIGYLCLVNFDAEQSVQLKELVELMSFFLGSEISNRLLLEKLEEMSHTDGLTRLNNRNAMIRRMHAMERRRTRESCGVANLDLNGLKTVNDSEGHDAGDRLLVRAAEALTKVFYREDVFRTGGDEFIIIAEGIEEDAFRRKLERLRSAAENSGVSFAVGACWSDGSVELSDAFRKADEAMYADKRACYARNPELRRR